MPWARWMKQTLTIIRPYSLRYCQRPLPFRFFRSIICLNFSWWRTCLLHHHCHNRRLVPNLARCNIFMKFVLHLSVELRKLETRQTVLSLADKSKFPPSTMSWHVYVSKCRCTFWSLSLRHFVQLSCGYVCPLRSKQASWGDLRLSRTGFLVYNI
jgi:hypothetical protein